MLRFHLKRATEQSEAELALQKARAGEEVSVSDYEVLTLLVELLNKSKEEVVFVRDDSYGHHEFRLDVITSAVREGMEVRPT